jgi:hypothetical protein
MMMGTVEPTTNAEAGTNMKPEDMSAKVSYFFVYGLMLP